MESARTTSNEQDRGDGAAPKGLPRLNPDALGETSVEEPPKGQDSSVDDPTKEKKSGYNGNTAVEGVDVLGALALPAVIAQPPQEQPASLVQAA